MAMSSLLEHVRVLDMSRILAGPWAGQLLADLGADVIKVERPGAGDDTRHWGPPFLTDSTGASTTESGYYVAVNRGKRSITVDLTTARGQQIIRQLARRSDILLENFKVGTLERYGLDYASLKALNPGLIYCSITGFGQSGPRRDETAYDFLIQAMSGLMSITGEPDGVPGGGPEKVGVPVVDIMTGMYAAVGVLAALERRRETGQGELIDLAMLDVGISMLSNRAMNYLVSGAPPRRTGNAHPNIQPQDVFRASDGHLVLVVGNDQQFARLCTAAGHPEWAIDRRFCTNSARVSHRAELKALLDGVLARKSVDYWMTLLPASGVPAGPINTIPRVFADPQVVYRKAKVQVEHPLAGSIQLIAPPFRFENNDLRTDISPPLLGEHTEEILEELSQEGNGCPFAQRTAE